MSRYLFAEVSNVHTFGIAVFMYSIGLFTWSYDEN